MYEVEILGLPEQLSRLDNYDRLSDTQLDSAMRSSVASIAADAQTLAPRFTGELAGSMTSRVMNEVTYITGEVYSSMSNPIYPLVMEAGRRPGARMPPIEAIRVWSDAVLGPGLAFVVARSIGRKGIKGHWFLKRAYEKNIPNILTLFKVAADRLTDLLAIGGS